MARKSISKADPKNTAVKTAENKTAPAEKKEVKPVEVKTAPVPADKEAPVKAAAKPEAVKPAAKKPAAKAAAKTSAKVAEKASEKKAASRKAKTAPKAEAKAPAKRPGRKPKPITIDDICGKVEKKLSKSKAAKIKGTIAVDIEIYGWENGENKHMYIELKDGRAVVAPYDYNEKTFRAHISFEDAVAFLAGKLTLKEAVVSDKIYAEGVVGDAVKIASLFE